jgi:hypothetical protein
MVRGCECGATWLQGAGIPYFEESLPVQTGDIIALKAALCRDHERRKRKGKQLPSEQCACGFVGPVDYVETDAACSALRKIVHRLEQGQLTTPEEIEARAEADEKRAKAAAVARAITAPAPRKVATVASEEADGSKRFEVWATPDYVGIHPRVFDNGTWWPLGGVDVPRDKVAEVVEAMRKAVGGQ